MVTTLTYLTGLDRARPVAASAASRSLPLMPNRSKVCGGAVTPWGTTGLAHITGAFTTNLPAGVVEQTIKRPARHLGTRST